MMKDFYLTDIIFYDAYTGENLQAWMQKRFVILQGEREIEVNSLSWYADYNLPQVTQNMVSFVSEPYRVCRRPLFLRECPDEKSKIHP